MIEYSDAIDEMFTLFTEQWNLNAGDVIGYVPEIRYQGVENKEEISLTKYWCRISQQTVVESQSSLRNGKCGQSYTNEGLVFVQLFCPTSDARAMQLGRKLATVARNAFRGKTTDNNVWFKNAYIKEIEPKDKDEWCKFNIITDYTYEDNS